MTGAAPDSSVPPDDRDAIVNRIRSYSTLGAPPEERDPAGNRVIYPSVAAVDDAVRFVTPPARSLPLPENQAV